MFLKFTSGTDAPGKGFLAEYIARDFQLTIALENSSGIRFGSKVKIGHYFMLRPVGKNNTICAVLAVKWEFLPTNESYFGAAGSLL